MSKTQILDLELLIKEYDNTIKQYNQAQLNYYDFIKNKPKMSIDNKFLRTPYGVYTSEKQINVTKVKYYNECRALCAKTKNCTGATYNNGNKMCSLQSGQGRVIGSKNGQNYAIVYKEIEMMNTIKSLNQKLTNINNKILAKIKSSRPTLNKDTTNRSNKDKQLLKNYNNLTRERMKIDKLINEHKYLEEKSNDLTASLNMYYSIFFILLTGCIFFIYLIITNTNFNILSNSGNNIYVYLLFVVVIIMLIIVYNRITQY